MNEHERDEDRPTEVDEPDRVPGGGHGVAASSAGAGSPMERGGVAGDVGQGTGDRGGSAGAAVGGTTSEIHPPDDPDEVAAGRETDETGH